MEPSPPSRHQKALTVHLDCASITDHTYDFCEYIHGEERAAFTEEFTIRLASLHDILFGVVSILFLRRLGYGQESVGVAKLPLRPFAEPTWPPHCTVAVLPPAQLKKADRYAPQVAPLGEALLRFTASPLPQELALRASPSPTRSLLSFFLIEERMRLYRVVFDLFLETQKGTLLCRLHWLFGLLSAEHYYSNVFGSCTCGKHGRRCQALFCRRSYRRIPVALAREIVPVLQFAAAAFVNSITVWRLRKVQARPEIQDPRRRAILERLGIPDEDLLEDFRGGDTELAFLAFLAGDRFVVSFKGTTSSVEAMHDLNCRYIEFQDGYTHSGILRLVDCFLATAWPRLRRLMARRGFTKLLLTGHSLGAAASVLAFLRMREHNLLQISAEEWAGDLSNTVTASNASKCSAGAGEESSTAQDAPVVKISSPSTETTKKSRNSKRTNVRQRSKAEQVKAEGGRASKKTTPIEATVVAFSAPPLFSESIAKRHLPEITIFNFGADIISRLCYGSVLDLKYLCISISSFYSYFSNRQTVINKITEIKEDLHRSGRYPKLYHAGMLYHIKEFKEDGKSIFLYKKVDYRFFEDLVCTRRAVTDHLIHRLLRAFDEALPEEE